MDEFALCWNNFQDNIASGFQNLYERGDLVDVTLACDGKLLQAHKIVLAICSPYFQEMFTSNPCKHPIIILKDVTSTVMSELLQFMYQGEVNVKHTELTAFMKIAETLQIKGLTTSQKSLNQVNNLNSLKSPSGTNDTNPQDNQQDPQQQSNNSLESKIIASGCTTPKSDNITGSGASTSQKRIIELSNNDSFTIYPRKARRIISDTHDHDLHSESMDNMHSEEVFLQPIPHISMIESRFDLNNVKRENIEPLNSPNMRNVLPAPFNFEYNNSIYVGNKNIEYPNDLHMASDFSKGVNHMDIPAVTPGEKWFQGKLEFMLSQRGKPLLVHDGYNFGIQYIRKDKKYWQCNLSRKYNCKARVTTTDAGDILVTNNEHCHTEIRQHLRKDYRNKMNNWQLKSETTI